MTEHALPRKVLDRIGHPRLLVLGDLILDQYTWGDAERVSPEAPVLILRVDTREVRLGGAASVAMLLRGLEAGVTLAGVIGDDPEGRTLQSLIKDEQIDTSQLLVVDKDRPTTTKERFVGRAANRHPHQILRVDQESRDPIDSKTAEWLATAIASRIPPLGKSGTCPMSKYRAREIATGREIPVPLCPELEDFDAVLISDYGKGVCTPRLVQMVIGFATERGVPVIIDPARIPDFDRYSYATLLKPNRAEAELATGMSIRTPEDALAAAAKLRQELQVEAVLITLDRDGMVLVRGDDVGEHFPTQPRTVYDITGAGDMVLAALGLCLASGISLQDSVQVANVAAGLEVEKLGVAPVSRRELKEVLALQEDATTGTPAPHSERCVLKSSSKLISLPELVQLTKEYRLSKKKLVFTNGCFDLLHVGHVTCLQEAATLGDVLIVAVNGDASVRRLKGEGRPVISEDDRAAMVAALDCVDHVLIFDEPTPHQLLELIQPDVLVKGGATAAIVGQEVVESYGGRICRVREAPGISTTTIVRQIHAAHPSAIPNSESRMPYLSES